MLIQKILYIKSKIELRVFDLTIHKIYQKGHQSSESKKILKENNRKEKGEFIIVKINGTCTWKTLFPVFPL